MLDMKQLYKSNMETRKNYIAEQQAITNAVTHINFQFDNNPQQKTDTVIFTDILSILYALENGSDVSKDINHLKWSLHNLTSRHNIRVVPQWIPAHTGIPGNERADALAKQCAGLPQLTVPVA